MITYLLISCLLIYAEGHPKHRRHRRDDDVGGITYAPCKDTYTQCPEWKKSGMCEMPQYRDYMPLVCTDTCGFCKGIQKARSEITAPTIIDATEHGAGDNVVNVVEDASLTRSKIHQRTKPSSALPKADIKEANKEEVSSGGDDDEENSGISSEDKSNDVSEKEEIEEGKMKNKNKIKKIPAEKKSVLKVQTKKLKSSQKSNTAERKSSTDESKKAASNKGTVNKKGNVNEKKSDTEKKGNEHIGKERSEVNELMSNKGDTAAIRNKKAEKKSSATIAKKVENLLTPRAKDKTDGAVKRTTKAKPDETDTSSVEISGAGSGESDADTISGDTPDRSIIHSGHSEADETAEDEDEDGDEDSDEDEEPAHQRQNFQLNGDPEMVDLKPKHTSPQPDLNDFPDKVDEKSNYSEDQEGDEKGGETGKTTDDEGELDDLKIEELLSSDDDKKKKSKKKTKQKVKKVKAVQSLKEGKISMVLQQNYNQLYDRKESPSYQMLAGNVKKDIEKMVKGSGVKDVAFSEVSVEGNPRQSGKTKVSFNIDASSNDWMKKLLKLVDSGDIDGLKVIKGSLEIEEE